MARYRSRRKSALRRLVMPISAIGFVLLVGYLLLPQGRRESAQAPGPATQPGPVAQTQKDIGAPTVPPALSAEKVAPIGAGPATRLARPPASQPAQDAPRQVAENTAKPIDAQPAGAGLSPEAPASRPATPVAPVATTGGAGLLAEAKALADSGKLLEARNILNDALQAGHLDHATADTVKARIRDLNQTIIFTPSRRYTEDRQQSTYTVQPGDNLVKICRDLAVPYGFIARINAVKPERIREGQSLKMIQGPIHAVVSKEHFTMDLYLAGLPGQPGSVYLTTYRVGLGENGSTPTGLWEVTKASKAVNPKWTNPRTNETFAPDDPKNPLGERWIGLTGISGDAVGAVSYGIHGTIEPQTIGTNASMGCIRLTAEDIVEVFDMLSEGRSTVLVVN